VGALTEEKWVSIAEKNLKFLYHIFRSESIKAAKNFLVFVTLFQPSLPILEDRETSLRRVIAMADAGRFLGF